MAEMTSLVCLLCVQQSRYDWEIIGIREMRRRYWNPFLLFFLSDRGYLWCILYTIRTRISVSKSQVTWPGYKVGFSKPPEKKLSSSLSGYFPLSPRCVLHLGSLKCCLFVLIPLVKD